MNLFLILLGKLILLLSKAFHLGSGSTWPGHIAMEVNPRFLKQVLKKNKHLKVILVAGTNGKTTTSLMLQKILEEDSLKVFRNEAGANLLNGMASTIINNSNIFGRLNYDVAVFEVDENNLKLALEELNPYAILILNIFRDQLDRYGEVNKIAKDWQEALGKVGRQTIIVTNGDDPELTHIALTSKLKAFFFGLDKNLMKQKEVTHDTDFNYCPKCSTELEYEKISFSHMGKFKCPKCGFANPQTLNPQDLHYPLFGQYNIYNTNAASVVAEKMFEIDSKTINEAFAKFKPAFGRQEKIKYKNRDVIILLSKNPAGFNQSIDAVNSVIASKTKQSLGDRHTGARDDKKANILLVLNDRIPDGRDVSWIWDVDFENLPKDSKIFISGDRAYDMGLRIKYSSLIHKSEFVIQNLNEAIEKAISETLTNEILFILPTYSAMLETRKILTGKAIL